MFIQLFNSNRATGLILLLCIATGLRVFAFFNPDIFLHIIHYPYAMPLDGLCVMVRNVLYLPEILSGILIVAEAIFINRIIIDCSVFPRQTWLPALFYVVLMSSHPNLLSLHPVIPANFFLMYAVSRFIGVFKSDKALSKGFDASFFTGIASLFYFPAAFLFFWIFTGLILFRNASLKSLLIAAAGFLLPYFFASIYFYWSDNLHGMFPREMVLNSFSAFLNENRIFLAFIVFVLFISLAAMVSMVRYISSLNIRQRKVIFSFFWFIFSALSTAMIADGMAPVIALASVGLVVILNQLYSTGNRWFTEFSFLLMAGLIVYFHILINL